MSPERLGHLVAGAVLQQVGHRPGPQGAGDRLLLAVHGEHHHPGLGDGLPQAAGGLDPVEHRHGDVHEHEVRLQRDGQADGLLAVSRFADHLEAGFLHRPPQSLAQQLVVVDEQQTGTHAAAS